jgi:lysine biosynthesis protein LysW
MVIQKTTTAECPDCGEKVVVGAPVKLGQRVVCSNCQADLIVVETVPVELDWYYEEEPEEDEDDDDW